MQGAQDTTMSKSDKVQATFMLPRGQQGDGQVSKNIIMIHMAGGCLLFMFSGREQVSRGWCKIEHGIGTAP